MKDKLSSGLPPHSPGLFICNQLKQYTMLENNAGNNGQLITVDAAKAKISVALTSRGLMVQSFHTRKSNLVLNRDPENIEAISQFLADLRAAAKITEESFKEIKKPYFEAGKACDAAKNETLVMIDELSKSVYEWFNKEMASIEKEKREAEEKIAREKQIKSGIEANILDFSAKIATCKTRNELVAVERMINLEKGANRASKYGDWHQFAIDRYNEVLLPVLKDQKTKVDEYEKLEEEKRAAEEANDPTKIDELNEKLQEKENEIIQNQVKVQEEALKQIVPPSNYAEEILPDVTKAGSNIVCEIVDEKIVYKKHRELLNVELKVSDAKKLATTLRDAGAFAGKDELIFDGMKFTIERRYK